MGKDNCDLLTMFSFVGAHIRRQVSVTGLYAPRPDGLGFGMPAGDDNTYAVYQVCISMTETTAYEPD